jgi:hypothetical protein
MMHDRKESEKCDRNENKKHVRKVRENYSKNAVQRFGYL